MKQYPPLAGAGGGQLKAGDIAITQVSAKKDILSCEE
jgi:hypothetical protein